MHNTLSTKIEHVRATLPSHVELVAVSKYTSVKAIKEVYDCGQRIFGESRVQELSTKHDLLPKDIQWHFIGHLQTNKVKYIAPYVAMIHSVDSLHLLAEIDRQAERTGRVIPCLLQLHVACEETKFGFTVDECLAMLDEGEWRKLKNVQIAGMMCMASNTDDQEQVASEFSTAHQCFTIARERHFADDPRFCCCSWGMSHDYMIAIENGATMVRLGSIIFQG